MNCLGLMRMNHEVSPCPVCRYRRLDAHPMHQAGEGPRYTPRAQSQRERCISVARGFRGECLRSVCVGFVSRACTLRARTHAVRCSWALMSGGCRGRQPHARRATSARSSLHLIRGRSKTSIDDLFTRLRDDLPIAVGAWQVDLHHNWAALAGFVVGPRPRYANDAKIVLRRCVRARSLTPITSSNSESRSSDQAHSQFRRG